jgi:hypothetical protein
LPPPTPLSSLLPAASARAHVIVPGPRCAASARLPRRVAPALSFDSRRLARGGQHLAAC